jgi:hypothetical protein
LAIWRNIFCNTSYFRGCKIWRFWVKKVYEKFWRFLNLADAKWCKKKFGGH